MTWLGDLKLWARFRLWAPLRANRYPSFYLSHSQFGEDMAVRGIVGEKRNGTFVDIGAHHPVYYSNTYHFYRKGWRGLNVDAVPGSMQAFRALRHEDVNVEACVGPVSAQTVQFFEFDRPAFNTLDSDAADALQRDGRVKLLRTRQLKTRTLVELLDAHLRGRDIDLLCIDVEGADEAILRSNDWTRYKPGVLVFERHALDLEGVSTDPLVTYLTGLGYVLEAKCGPSFIMKDAQNAGA